MLKVDEIKPLYEILSFFFTTPSPPPAHSFPYSLQHVCFDPLVGRKGHRCVV